MRFRLGSKNSRRRKSHSPRARLDPLRTAPHRFERLELRALLTGDPSLGLTLSPAVIAENAGPGAVMEQSLATTWTPARRSPSI